MLHISRFFLGLLFFGLVWDFDKLTKGPLVSGSFQFSADVDPLDVFELFIYAFRYT